MKRNAIARIILYSILALTLTGIMISGICADFFMYYTDIGGVVEESAEYDAAKVKNIEINWAGGNVTLTFSDTDQIIVMQSKPEGASDKMYCALDGDTLIIDYSKQHFHIGSLPEKDLLIQVPRGWVCEELVIDGAGLNISINGPEIRELDLDGAGISLDFTGTFQTLSCDGAGCDLVLTLPSDAGFLVDTNGLGCDFRTSVPYTTENGSYVYGDRKCQVTVDGLRCRISIKSQE